MRTGLLALLVVLHLQAQSTASTSSAKDDPPTPAPAVCPAGNPIGDVNLQVESSRGQSPLPLRTINRLSEGDTVLYSPVVRGHVKRHGEVTLVLVPAVHKPGQDGLIVTDPKRADLPQSWKIPETMSLAAFVYGPAGLSKRKVKGFLSQDDLLIAQLADYAAKTAETEALIQALESGESTSESLNAALSGFASQYGLGVQLDRAQPANQQAMTLFATLNPALATYDPIQPSALARYSQTASVATAVATLFFGNPVGLAAGGTAMLLDLRAVVFPGTEFRSSFAEPLANNRGLNLCGSRAPVAAHTRVAYIWATRIPNEGAPIVEIEKSNYLPISQKSPLPVDAPEREWKYLERAHDWTLVNGNGQKTTVPVLKLANQKALELDLTKFKLPPGDYRLHGFWDWQPFEVKGSVHIESLSDFKNAQLEPDSQDKLIAKTGKIPVTLASADFEFITKVELKKAADEFATAEPVPFKLPIGLRDGPQRRMDLQIDTSALDPGVYDLLIDQQDNRTHTVPIKILPSLTKIENLPLIANEGVGTENYVLKGENLHLIARLEMPGAVVDLGTAGATERKITVHLEKSPPVGTTLEMKAYLNDRHEPLTFAEAIRVTGPLPAITAATPAPPVGMAIQLRDNEFPAGYTLSASINVKNVQPVSVLELGCFGDPSPRLLLHPGEETDTASLQKLGAGAYFVSFDTSRWPAGCSVQARWDNGGAGKSQPFTLGGLIRIPQIDSFQMTAEDAGNNLLVGVLTGRNLETIEKVGWDLTTGYDVPGLPSPIPGPGQKQTLRVSLPAPPNPQSVLNIWLRGEQDGRVTTITAASPATPTATTSPSPNGINPPSPN